MDKLAAELRILRDALRSNAEQEVDSFTVTVIAEAEEAAARDDKRKVGKALAKAGKAALQTARDIGVEVAATAISRSAGGA
jgi:hypothetical protein